jgi:tRNA pseudouridine55 synthase
MQPLPPAAEPSRYSRLQWMDSSSPSGFLVLDKPGGLSSAQLLNRLKPRLPRGTKLGHAGTLDPFATGVLVALVGRATKQCERVMGLPKGYEAEVRLDATTPSLDPETPAQPVAVETPPSCEQIEAVLAGMVGQIQQAPPVYSAIKVSGRRAYDLARSGHAPELARRPVRVYRLALRSYAWPNLRLDLECGRGFYVRSLAGDIGQALGVGGYLTALRRTFVGPFDLSRAVALDAEPLELLPLDFLGN